jgi:hypothetical protein
MHNEPITVRVLSGKDGQPQAHLHLLLIAGYDQGEMHDHLFHEEALTDAQGQARLSNQIANLPWLQVWVGKKMLCQARPRSESFSVELIRRDGFSAPNRCGIATVEDRPGVFTVFVKSKGKGASKSKSVKLLRVKVKLQSPIVASISSHSKPAAPPAVPAPVPVIAARPTPAPVETAVEAAPPGLADILAAAPAAVVVDLPTSRPVVKAEAQPVIKRPAARAVARRTVMHKVAHHLRKAAAVPKAAPVQTACAAPLPADKADKAAPVRTSVRRPKAATRTMAAPHRMKPRAGTKPSAAKPAAATPAATPTPAAVPPKPAAAPPK